MRCGGVLVPLIPLMAEKELAQILANCEAVAIITIITLVALSLSHSFGFTSMNKAYKYGNLHILMRKFQVEEAFILKEGTKATTEEILRYRQAQLAKTNGSSKLKFSALCPEILWVKFYANNCASSIPEGRFK